MITDYETQAKIFRALCDANRLKILALLRSGEKCACQLQAQLDVGQSGLSYHMKILMESGIVESRQEGKWTHYQICEKGCAEAEVLLKQLTTPDRTAHEKSGCPS